MPKRDAPRRPQELHLVSERCTLAAHEHVDGFARGRVVMRGARCARHASRYSTTLAERRSGSKRARPRVGRVALARPPTCRVGGWRPRRGAVRARNSLAHPRARSSRRRVEQALVFGDHAPRLVEQQHLAAVEQQRDVAQLEDLRAASATRTAPRRPLSRIFSMRAKHLRWNASSPTASASSTIRMSRRDGGRHREREAQRHAARIRLDRPIDEIADVGEGQELGHQRAHLARAAGPGSRR